MSKVCSHMTMSLDGFIADPQDGAGELFGWYSAGEVTVPSGDARWSFELDENSAEMIREMLANTGALVCGRRLFDLTNGWDDSHPVGAPVVVVTHRPPEDTGQWKSTTFAADVAAGITEAKGIAGDKNVTIASASIAQQALDLGLLDEVHISLVPVVLGAGIPYFAQLTRSPHRFDDPVVIQGSRVTHLKYAVRPR
ncbi:dihydrofolate reductase family protein [Amycolatopsis sp. H20-H5]|uniref:dihydrofolate reductase family protein n=1 Tax=Amycolatopsis sp. H20-H5 TaxID=3046309 RepID=UPI002DBB1782|nr:dihydrofolate reductase family protein [Amycolatopsis sp. H20-H5]MEC3976573.1 dihydrofolate reductase family protein [Amycolatopsis sp. H20-H5]